MALPSGLPVELCPLMTAAAQCEPVQLIDHHHEDSEVPVLSCLLPLLRRCERAARGAKSGVVSGGVAGKGRAMAGRDLIIFVEAAHSRTAQLLFVFGGPEPDRGSIIAELGPFRGSGVGEKDELASLYGDLAQDHLAQLGTTGLLVTCDPSDPPS